MSSGSLTVALKEEAARLGFDLAGATAAVGPPGYERFRRWLDDGFAGEMHYLAEHAEAYRHPRHLLEGVRSILVLATNYRTVEPIKPKAGEAVVSRYAWGADYHDVIHDRLRRLTEFHRRLVPGAKVRGVVDTAPLVEREFAARAGLGWVGKNTCLLNRKCGSWIFLAALLTSEELDDDQPSKRNYCGTCRACLDACPTGALVAPYRLDARKCISYLTIELRDSIPSELREPVGNCLFGCDRCQDVCPWNRKVPVTKEQAFHPSERMNPIALAELFALDDDTFRRRFRHTPLWRAKRSGILRNAAVVLGNRPHDAAVPALRRGLEDTEPIVRAACAWALDRFVRS